MKQKTNANAGRRLKGTIFAGMFLLASAAALVPATTVASHESCGEPDQTIGVVHVWRNNPCTGASVTLPRPCAHLVDDEVLFVTVVVFGGDFPCTVAGVWVKPPQ